MKTIIFLFSALVSFSSFAQQISDPNGLLAQADQFLGSQPFQKNFVEGSKYTQSFKDCSFCRDEQITYYTVSSVHVDEQGTSTATILGTPHGMQFTVPSNAWNSWNGNMIRAVIYSVTQGGFGAVTVLDAHAGHMDVKIDGQMKSVETFTVHATAKNQVGMKLDEVMTVSRDLLGYAQLVTWTEKQSLGATYTRTMTEFSH